MPPLFHITNVLDITFGKIFSIHTLLIIKIRCGPLQWFINNDIFYIIVYQNSQRKGK